MMTRLAAAARKYDTELRKVIGNTGWLVSDRFLRLGVGFFVGAWVARYLSPERFGLLRLCKMDGSSEFHL